MDKDTKKDPGIPIDPLSKEVEETMGKTVYSEPTEEMKVDVEEEISGPGPEPIPSFDSKEHWTFGQERGATSRPKKSPYEILGVPSNASQIDIKRAYRKLANRYHPDSNPDSPDAAEWSKLVNVAYGFVGNPENRQLYDQYGYSIPRDKEPSFEREEGPSKSYIEFHERLAGEKESALNAAVPGLGPFGEVLSPYFGSFSEIIDTKSPKAGEYMRYLRDWDKQQELISKTPYCICDRPLFPKGYTPKGKGKDKCTWCGKPVVPGAPKPKYKDSGGLKGGTQSFELGSGLSEIR